LNWVTLTAIFGGIAFIILIILYLLLTTKANQKKQQNGLAPKQYIDNMDQAPIPATGGEARVQQPSGVTHMAKLSPGSNLIGRGNNNAICLDDPKVSSKHADLYLSEGRYTVTDLDSRNGTYVNGEKITQKDVYHGDQIQMGDSTIFV
jgi:pSer/pThr/pTyr-binding forkhead associated (FHA) protein